MYRTEAPLPPTRHDADCASLALDFAADAGCTRLVGRRHSGPLRVQKPLYPEGQGICHAIVVHPPGGVVGGDQLAIRAGVGDGAAAFLTTPGAAKWYKANGRISRQDVRLTAGAGATLEWLPQESIFFDCADVELRHSVELDTGARYIGGDILCFGRTASGETFDSGSLRQQNSIRLDGKLVWFEQGRLQGGSAGMRSPLGLAGYSVCATLIAVGGTLPASLLPVLRGLGLGATLMKNLLVARLLCNDSEIARRQMTAAWQHIRPVQMERAAPIPRIWQT